MKTVKIYDTSYCIYELVGVSTRCSPKTIDNKFCAKGSSGAGGYLTESRFKDPSSSPILRILFCPFRWGIRYPDRRTERERESTGSRERGRESVLEAIHNPACRSKGSSAPQRTPPKSLPPHTCPAPPSCLGARWSS